MTDTLVQESALRLFVDLSTPEIVNAAEEGTWPTALWDAVAAAGFLDAMASDGAEPLAGLPDTMAILRAAGRHAAPVPLAETILARWLAVRAGLRVPDGPLALLVERPDEALGLRKTDRSWQISARASAVPWGRAARAVVVSVEARVALVDVASAAIEPGFGMAGEPRDALVFDRTLDADMVAAAPQGIDAALVYRLGALGRAALMAGALEAALEIAVAYANDRVQFGRPIGKLQAIQQQLALAAEQVAASGVAVSAGVAGALAGDLVFTAAAAKLRVGEAAGKVADVVHQVMGAIGFTHEHRLHHLTRRLWSWRDEFGTEAVWAAELGRLAAAQGADGLWPFLARR